MCGTITLPLICSELLSGFPFFPRKAMNISDMASIGQQNYSARRAGKWTTLTGEKKILLHSHAESPGLSGARAGMNIRNSPPSLEQGWGTLKRGAKVVVCLIS